MRLAKTVSAEAPSMEKERGAKGTELGAWSAKDEQLLGSESSAVRRKAEMGTSEDANIKVTCGIRRA